MDLRRLLPYGADLSKTPSLRREPCQACIACEEMGSIA